MYITTFVNIKYIDLNLSVLHIYLIKLAQINISYKKLTNLACIFIYLKTGSSNCTWRVYEIYFNKANELLRVADLWNYELWLVEIDFTNNTDDLATVTVATHLNFKGIALYACRTTIVAYDIISKLRGNWE